MEAEDDEQTHVGNMRHLKSLTFFIFLAIGTCFLAALIGFFDVRVYYTFGRFGLFLIATGSLALNVWLALRISEGMNWARVTFVVISVLSCFAVASGSLENEYAYYATLIAAVLNLICAGGMFLLRSVSACFRETRNGIKCAIIYLCSHIGFVAVVAAHTLIYQSANKAAYFNDWVAAVREGSQKARSRMIAYVADGVGIQKATEQVDTLCPKKKKNESSGNADFLILLLFLILLYPILPALYGAWMENDGPARVHK